MKKNIICLILTVSLMLFFLASGCSTKKVTVKNKCLEGAPDWVLNPHVRDGYYSEVGISKILHANGMGTARTKAIEHARNAIAKQLTEDIKSKIDYYVKEKIISKKVNYDELFYYVYENIVKYTLTNASYTDRRFWISPCNEYYAFIEIRKPKNFEKLLDKDIKDFIKNR